MTLVFPVRTEIVPRLVGTRRFQRAIPLGFTPSPDSTISSYSVVFDAAFGGADGEITIDSPDTSESFDFEAQSNRTITFFIEEISFTIVGDTLCFAFRARFTDEFSIAATWNLDVSATVTVTDSVSFEQTIATFATTRENGASIGLYGYRPRSTPLVIGIYQATPLADGFAPDYAELNAAMQADLDAYATPIPVFAVERACDTADHRPISWRGG